MYVKALAVTLLGFSAAVLADGGSAAAVPPAASAQSPAAPAPASATPDEKVSQNQPHVSGCLQDTGTHLRTRPGDCLSSPGHSYSSDEMRSTGASNSADALRLMDPSLTTTR
jgi:hypothetical protein